MPIPIARIHARSELPPLRAAVWPMVRTELLRHLCGCLVAITHQLGPGRVDLEVRRMRVRSRRCDACRAAAIAALFDE
jgi:hypothetical protein